MQQFDREHATLLATVMRQALDGGRWMTNRYTEGKLSGLERALSIVVDAGQPDFEAINDGILHVYASDFMVQAQAAYLDGSLVSPTLIEESVLSPNRAHLAHVVGMHAPAARTGEIVDIDFQRRRAPEALAA